MVKMKTNLRSLVAITLVTTTVIFSSSITKVVNAATPLTQTTTVTKASTSNNYSLADSTKDGVILHAWDWSFNTINANLKSIAEAGYTSVQVSPIQGTKASNMGTSYWWLLYQPTNFSIGNAQLGTRAEFESMCTEAHKYGIKIIVDVVANHMANRGDTGTDPYYADSTVDSDLRDDANCWHEHLPVSSWTNRWEVTQHSIGEPDLNTANTKVQNKIISFLNDCIACGADGFRFDAAKHIELPTEAYCSSNFWTNVLGSLNNKNNLFIYGEVLQGDADNFATYANYMNLIASNYGTNVRNAVGYSSSKNVYSATDYSSVGVTASHLVTEVETHDTYANNNFNSTSTSMTPWQIKMGWALIAARANSVPLYFDRPTSPSGNIGDAGNTNWEDADVVAVNKFHNLMAGQNEYLREQSNYVTMIERGTKGAVIVNLDNATTLSSTTNLADGTYTNHASTGGTFTVSNGKITGNLPAGITVLYNEDTPTVSVSNEGDQFVDSLALTLGTSNSTSATYSINNGTAKSYTNGQSITIGADAAVGDKITLTLNATNGTTTATKTYTYTKAPVPTASTVYFYNTNNWSNPYVYVYNDSGTTVTKIAAWPGVAMTKVSTGLYSYTIPKSFGDAKVIFSNNGSSQVPASGQAGYSITSGTSMEYNNGTWQTHIETVVDPTVSSSKDDCTFTDSLTLTLGTANSTSATYTIDNGTATAYTDGQTITIGTTTAAGAKITLTLNATNGTTTATKTYTYTKAPVSTASTVYFYNTNNWSNPYAYVYNDSGTTVTKIAAWPGVAMTKVSTGLYSYTIPKSFGDAKVIFSNNGSNQVPASGKAGYSITAGTSMVYNNGNWSTY